LSILTHGVFAALPGKWLLFGDTVVTPEPATAGLVATSLIGLGLMLWQRRRNWK